VSPTRCAHANDLFPSNDSEERLVFLPLCHVAERVGGYYTSLALGSVMNFAESPETVPDNLREVQPTAFLAVPRVWEKFYSGVHDRTEGCDPPLQNWMYRHAPGAGPSHDRLQAAGRYASAAIAARQFRLPTGWCSATSAACWGLDRCRLAFTGAAPIAPDLIRWYLALGIDMARGLRPDRKIAASPP